MATVLPVQKRFAANPLKSSQPLGAALAYLGVARSVPLFHGSQGCTSFALVLACRHFKETIPFQTTAIDEIAAVLGGADHLEEAIVNLKTRTDPALIGICTTALVETSGEDFSGDVAMILRKRGEMLGETRLVLAETPDFAGALEAGWSAAVTAMIRTITRPRQTVAASRVAILPGWHLTVGDIELIRETVEMFGLEAVILPDLASAVDGTVPERWIPTSYGGCSVADIETLADVAHVVAIGEHMRRPAEVLAAKGADYTLFPTLTGLEANDAFLVLLSELSGQPVPAKLRRRRSQLCDALLDGHFHFSGKRVALAAEPDLLFTLSRFFADLGAETVLAVTTAGDNPILKDVPAETVQVGDLADVEDALVRAETPTDLLVTHAHGRQIAERLGIPLFRVGFPVFDRLGCQHKVSVGYEGTRDLIFEVANLFQSVRTAPTPASVATYRFRERTA